MDEEVATTTASAEETENVQPEKGFITELDEMFKGRFTEEDPDFMETMQREEIPPPLVANFLDLKYQRDRDEQSRHERYNRSDRRDRDERNKSREDKYRGDHRRDRSRSPHRQSAPKMPDSYYYYYY